MAAKLRQISVAMTATPMIARFGAYEANLHTGELRKSGMRIKIQDQPFEVLIALLENPGRLVLREELQKRLWPQTPFMDFDHGLNLAVKKLRDALNDSAESPRYVETLARKGYRFISPVEFVSENDSTRRSASSRSSDHGSTPGAATAHDGGGSAVTRGWRRSWTVGLLALVLLMASAAAYFFAHSEHSLKFARQDWVLIAAFDNRTGEPVLDGTLEIVLRSYLSDSHFVNVAPQERINDTLRLMRLPITSRITPAIGREICLRDGGIQAMLTGTVAKLGKQYAITVFVVDPGNGVTVASEVREASSKDELLAAMRRLPDSLLHKLGQNEAEIRTNSEKLERVTTQSLEALHLFSQAEAKMRAGEETDKEAEQLLRAALDHDPQFASAWNLLGWSIARQSNRDERDYIPFFDRAFQLADTASDHEAQFIRASYYHQHHDIDRAIAGYEAVTDAYPDDYWSANNAWLLSMNRGHEAEAARFSRHIADDLRPNQISANYQAWKSNDATPEIADKYRNRVAQLCSLTNHAFEACSRSKWYAAVLDLVDRGDIDGAVQAARRIGPQLAAAERERQFAGALPVNFALATGQLKTAEQLAWPDLRWARLQIAELSGDKPEVQKAAEELSRPLDPDRFVLDAVRWPYLLARAGFASRAKQLLDQFFLDHSRAVPIGQDAGYGSAALGMGNTSEAIRRLRIAVKHFSAARQLWLFFSAEEFARALDQNHQTDEAIRVLEPLEKDHRFNFESSLAPGMDRLLLAQLYRKVGRIDDARRVESELLALWKYADPDFQPLIQLKRQSQMPLISEKRTLRPTQPKTGMAQ